jgi:hypothetical protein
MSRRRIEEHWRQLKRKCFGKIKTDGEAWLLYDPYKSGYLKKRRNIYNFRIQQEVL